MASIVTTNVVFNTTSGTHAAGVAVQAGDLIVVVTASTGNTSAALPTDNLAGGTYVTIATALKAVSADTMMVHVRTGVFIAAGTATVTHAPGVSTGGGLAIFVVRGMSRSATLAILQSAKEENQAATGTPAPVLPAVPQSSNPIIGAVFNSSNPATITQRTLYTEQHDVGYVTPTTGLETMTRDSGENSATITWGSTSATEFCDLVVELDSSPYGPGGAMLDIKGGRTKPQPGRPGPGLPGLSRFWQLLYTPLGQVPQAVGPSSVALEDADHFIPSAPPPETNVSLW